MRTPLAAGLAVAALVAAADQATKAWVLAFFTAPDAPPWVAVTSVLNLVLVWNRGVSFGMLGDGAVTPWALGLVAAAIVVALVIWMHRAESRGLAAALGLIVGGAIGNIIDRLAHGAVVDFVDVHYGGWHWPAFNLADSAITLGVAWLVFDSFVGGSRRAETGEKESS